jgi:hypothetical protein
MNQNGPNAPAVAVTGPVNCFDNPARVWKIFIDIRMMIFNDIMNKGQGSHSINARPADFHIGLHAAKFYRYNLMRTNSRS